MINFTDMTGLAGSTVAITALATQLPGVVRLQRKYFALLSGAIAIAVLIPSGGLSLAACVRGWMGDLSITSLLLLTLAIINVKLAQRDFVPLARLRERAGERGTGVADVIIGEADMPVKPLLGVSPFDAKAHTPLLILIALAALMLYPMALGVGYFDPYRLGYGNPWFIGGLLLLALAACFRQLSLVALVIALAVLAWGVGWYESTNLWDYLLDPLLAIYAISSLLKRGIQALLKRS